MEDIETNTDYTEFLFNYIDNFEKIKTNANNKIIGNICCNGSFNPKTVNKNGDTILGATLIKILNKISNYHVEMSVFAFVSKLIQTNMFDLSHKNNENKSIFDIIFQIVFSKVNTISTDKIIAEILLVDNAYINIMDKLLKELDTELNLLIFLIKYKLKNSIKIILENLDYDLTFQNSQGYTAFMYAIEKNLSGPIIQFLDSGRDFGIELTNNVQNSAIFMICKNERKKFHYLIKQIIISCKLKPDLLSSKGYNIFTEYVIENLHSCDFCCLDSRICYFLFKFCLGHNYDYTKPIYVPKLDKTFPNMLYFLCDLKTPYTDAFLCEFIKYIDIQIDYKNVEKCAKEKRYICIRSLLESNKFEDMDKYPNKKEIFENIFALACYGLNLVPYCAEQTAIEILASSYSTCFDKRKSLLQLHNSIIENNIYNGSITNFLANEDWLKELVTYNKGIFKIDLKFAYEEAKKNKLERVCKFILDI